MQPGPRPFRYTFTNTKQVTSTIVWLYYLAKIPNPSLKQRLGSNTEKVKCHVPPPLNLTRRVIYHISLRYACGLTQHCHQPEAQAFQGALLHYKITPGSEM